MKKEWLLLVSCMSMALNSCAFAMGRNRCDAPDIPIRPGHEVCIPNGDGSASCYDPRSSPSKYTRIIRVDDIVTNIKDYNSQEEWVFSVLRACRR